MFGVDQDPVETCARDHLRGDVAAQAAPETDLRSPFANRLFEGIGGQVGIHGFAGFVFFRFFSAPESAGGGRTPLSSSFLESMSAFTPSAGIGRLSDHRTPWTTKRRYSGNCQLA